MNKSDLVAVVAEATGISKSEATNAIDATFDVIADALKNGDDVRLSSSASREREWARHPGGRSGGNSRLFEDS